MIYLIKSAGIIKETNELCFLLKIGYTNDNNEYNRFAFYKNHNPTIQVLYKIKGGSSELEKKLHSYFINYRKYGIEWYEYNEFIITFFEENNTIDLIENKLKNIENVLGKRPLSSFQLEKERIKLLINSLPENNWNRKFLEQFDSMTIFKDKMKYLCESKLSENEINVILDQIPLIYKNYYTSIGPDRCRANSYNKNELEKELQEQKFDINEITRELDLIFKIGEKYTKKDIKEKLGTIYKSIGYTKTPKATDLENYYIIKKCQKTKSGIRSECFKIISKK